MPDVFISYSSRDFELARWIYDKLSELKVPAFLAEISIQGGQDWKPEILANLRQADFVLFLATPQSCASDAVKHEIGAALVLQKAFVPILAGVNVGQLPAWTRDKQAVDIRDGAQIRAVFERIASAVASKRFVGGLIAGVLIAVAVHFFTRKS